MRLSHWFFLCLMLLAIAPAHAFKPFVIADTTFNYLPVKVGETLTDEKASAAIRALFKTGFFEDVRLRRQGRELVIEVKERPSIAKIEIFGNEDLGTEDLNTALKQVGLVEGRVFNRSILDQFSLGKYAVKIETTIKPLARNRVEVALDISEGKAAQIRQINIVGAKAFQESRLLDEFQLSTPTMISFIDSSGKYSKQQLLGDLEKLRSYYLDRGYLHFNIESTQVSITPTKRDVYITINVSEGERYHVGKVQIAGDLVVPEAELRALLQVHDGQVFSRRDVAESSSKISERLGIDKKNVSST